ncbi:MAG: TnpV protein [Eubacteriales bacterium]|nr:TnpV protein [Eubacteriales bacterium]
MTDLKERIHDEHNGLDYVLVGDYYVPELTLPETDHRSIGLWGQLHKAYLKQYCSPLYNELILTCKLHSYLANLNEQAQERVELIVEQMKNAENVTEDLKRRDPMEWVRQMNSIKSRAEEIIKKEMIYC